MNAETVNLRFYTGLQDYAERWQAMRDFTNQRQPETLDEIWALEHHPVFTQGQNGKPENVLNPGTIPIVQSDRGGQITYHGPGQLLLYTLIDVKRKKLNVRELVTALEKSVIEYLASQHITSTAKCAAPGVYVNEQKICSVGLRIHRGCSYHGLAFNIDMDLNPFTRINPCGFATLQMTQLRNLNPNASLDQTKQQLALLLSRNLGYTSHQFIVE